MDLALIREAYEESQTVPVGEKLLVRNVRQGKGNKVVNTKRKWSIIKWMMRLGESTDNIKKGLKAMKNGVKPGVHTTEFWGKTITQMVSALFALAVSLGWVEPNPDFQGAIILVLVASVPLLEAFYTHSRGKVKSSNGNGGDK